VNKTGISLLLDSVRSVNDSYLFTHMRLPCPQGGREQTEYVAPPCANDNGKRIRLIEIKLRVIQDMERGAMNRRHFGLSIAGAALLAQQLRQAVAQGAGGSPSGADTDAAWRMRDAASAFLESLDEAARKAVSFPLEADQRTSWSNLPVAIVPRVGINIGALGVQSRRRLHDLLRASTSSQGYHKIAAIMRHDDLLRAEELEYLQHNPPRPRAGRNAIESMGSANYWVAMFGEPVRGRPWAWLLTGHHLGATFTCASGRVTAAPLFLGAQPLEDLTGPYAGFAVLSHEGLRGLDLVGSLHPEQAKVAVLSTEPFFSDVLTGVGRRNSLSRFEGLPAGDLDAPQKRLLVALVEEYVRNADFDAAERHLEAIQRAGLDQLHFSWRGPTNDFRSPFYYRIHGPRLIIEFAVQEPNHVHTIMRDPQNDYGMDWLGLHYEEHAWSGR